MNGFRRLFCQNWPRRVFDNRRHNRYNRRVKGHNGSAAMQRRDFNRPRPVARCGVLAALAVLCVSTWSDCTVRWIGRVLIQIEVCRVAGHRNWLVCDACGSIIARHELLANQRMHHTQCGLSLILFFYLIKKLLTISQSVNQWKYINPEYIFWPSVKQRYFGRYNNINYSNISLAIT